MRLPGPFSIPCSWSKSHACKLVDGARLTQLMERLQLGVKPRTVYDVDRRFFEAFRAPAGL